MAEEPASEAGPADPAAHEDVAPGPGHEEVPNVDVDPDLDRPPAWGVFSINLKQPVTECCAHFGSGATVLLAMIVKEAICCIL